MKPNYNDRYTISRVISIIQELHPDLNVGDYVAHAPSNDNRGVRVQLTNGRILVTHTAIEDVDHAYKLQNYADFMITTFQPDQQTVIPTPQEKKTFLQKILSLIGIS